MSEIPRPIDLPLGEDELEVAVGAGGCDEEAASAGSLSPSEEMDPESMPDDLPGAHFRVHGHLR